MAARRHVSVWILFPGDMFPDFCLLCPGQVPDDVFSPADLLRLADEGDGRLYTVSFLGHKRPSTLVKGESMEYTENMLIRASDTCEIYLRIEEMAPATATAEAGGSSSSEIDIPSSLAEAPGKSSATLSGVFRPHGGCAAEASRALRWHHYDTAGYVHLSCRSPLQSSGFGIVVQRHPMPILQRQLML